MCIAFPKINDATEREPGWKNRLLLIPRLLALMLLFGRLLLKELLLKLRPAN